MLDLQAVLPLFADDARILALYVLGSANEGRMRSDSDVDLALLPEPGESLDQLEGADLAAEASLRLRREVDLGDISSHNLVYAREAILRGTRLFTRDRFRVELRECNLLGMYVNFQAERAELIDAYTT